MNTFLLTLNQNNADASHVFRCKGGRRQLPGPVGVRQRHHRSDCTRVQSSQLSGVPALLRGNAVILRIAQLLLVYFWYFKKKRLNTPHKLLMQFKYRKRRRKKREATDIFKHKGYAREKRKSKCRHHLDFT